MLAPFFLLCAEKGLTFSLGVVYYVSNTVEVLNMIIQIDTHSGVPIYRQVMDQVRCQIMTGVLKNSEKLLSVRDLSSKLKVNPMTVSKAYAYLEMEGLLRRERGVGLFVDADNVEQVKDSKSAIVREVLEKSIADAKMMGVSEKEYFSIAESLWKELSGKLEDKEA